MGERERERERGGRWCAISKNSSALDRFGNWYILMERSENGRKKEI